MTPIFKINSGIPIFFSSRIIFARDFKRLEFEEKEEEGEEEEEEEEKEEGRGGGGGEDLLVSMEPIVVYERTSNCASFLELIRAASGRNYAQANL